MQWLFQCESDLLPLIPDTPHIAVFTPPKTGHYLFFQESLSLTASGLKLYTDHNDRLLLPEQDKVLYLLACLICSFLHLPLCLCLYCSYKRCPSHPSLIASRRTFQRRVLSESAFHPQHLTWKLHAMDIQLIFTDERTESRLTSTGHGAQSLIHSFTYSFIHLLISFHLHRKFSPIGCFLHMTIQRQSSCLLQYFINIVNK